MPGVVLGAAPVNATAMECPGGVVHVLVQVLVQAPVRRVHPRVAGVVPSGGVVGEPGVRVRPVVPRGRVVAVQHSPLGVRAQVVTVVARVVRPGVVGARVVGAVVMRPGVVGAVVARVVRPGVRYVASAAVVADVPVVAGVP